MKLLEIKDAAGDQLVINIDAIQFIRAYDPKWTQIHFTCGGRCEFVVVGETLNAVKTRLEALSE